MTSFTKALYRRDPAAALAFYNDSKRDQFDTSWRADARSQGGRKPSLPTIGFGQRTPSPGAIGPMSGGWVACVTRCTHPSCAQGCTLAGRK